MQASLNVFTVLAKKHLNYDVIVWEIDDQLNGMDN